MRLLDSFELVGKPQQGIGDGIGGRGQQLAQNERHQLTLASGKSIEPWRLQIFRDEGIEPLFVVVRDELLNQSVAIGVTDVREYLPTESALADWPDTLSKCAIVFRRVHP